MTMCTESMGRDSPFRFLKDVCDTFFLMFTGQETSLEGSIARSFRGVLAQKMKTYSDAATAAAAAASAASASGGLPSSALSASHGGSNGISSDPPQHLAKLHTVKRELDTLAMSAKSGIDKALARGAAIEGLNDRARVLSSNSDRFRADSLKLNRRLCWENFKLKLIVAIAMTVVIYFLMTIKCGIDLSGCI